MPIELPHGMIIEVRDRPVERIVFPISGITSIIAIEPGKGRRIEAGLFGRDGMSGTPVLLGAQTAPNEMVVQVPGHGLQISSDLLRQALERSPSLHQYLLRFVQALLLQTSQTALSNRHHKLEERLARWLLMCHDRIEGNSLHLTHEYMAIMLGTRRAGVTIGTQILEGKGVIKAGRGEIVILDRVGLEEEAGGSYGIPEAEYLKLFGGGA